MPRKRRPPCDSCHELPPAGTRLVGGMCAVCARAMHEDYVEPSPKRLRKYDLDADTFGRLYLAQRARCAICKRKEPLVIDHDHDTGEVRGLLCSTCNSALGLMRDSPARLAAAIIYLEESRLGVRRTDA